MLLFIFLLCAGLTRLSPSSAYPTIDTDLQDQTPASDSQRDDVVSRRVLGSSVVTSVSVIMDTGSDKLYSDAVGKPQSKPTSGQVASPINLLNPDRYEFYTFSDSGDLVKRLMTLSEIQGIIANADGEAFNQNSHSPEKKVNDVVSNVQNVLKGEIEKGSNYNATNNIVMDTPDVSSSWSVILPAIFGNSGEEIKPARPVTSMTPETIMLEHQTETVPIVQKPEPFTRITTTERTTTVTTKTKKPTKLTTENENLKTPSTYKPSTYKAPSSTLKPPTTTKKPIKVTTTKVPTPRTTPTTAIPKITTRGTRPNRRTTTTSTTTMTPKPEEVTVQERVKLTTTSSEPTTLISEASSHFIQLFDPVQTIEPHKSTPGKPIFIRTTPRTPSSTTSQIPEGALFIVDEKTKTRIPITNKEQLESILNQLEDSSTSIKTDLIKNANVPGLTNEPLITLNSVSGHQTPNLHALSEPDSVATTSNVQSTTQVIDDFDIDKYQQLLLTSTNIYEINKELARSTTTMKPSKVTNVFMATTTPRAILTTVAPTKPVVSATTKVSTVPSSITTVPSTTVTTSSKHDVPDILGSTIKEPNLVNSIEQLLQQAVGNIQEYEKTTKVIPKQTTNLEVTSTAVPSTTEQFTTFTESPSTVPTTEVLSTVPPTAEIDSFSDDLLLNEAMGSLLSQVVSSDFQGLSTFQDLPGTTENTDRANESLEFRIKTTDIYSETTEGTTQFATTDTDLKGGTTEGKLSDEDATKQDQTDSSLSDTTETTQGNNEILKTDATTYRIGNPNKITTDSFETSSITELVPEGTTEIVEDLPVVFDLGLNEFMGKEDQKEPESLSTTELPQLSTITEEKVEKISEQLEKQIQTTTHKIVPEVVTESNLVGLRTNTRITTEALVESTVKETNLDSDSLPSTNSYKEVTGNAADDGSINIEDSKDEATLSIDDLIKELTTKTEGQEGPKETTVLIITKPLYSTTTPTTTTSTTTTTTTEAHRRTTEVPKPTTEAPRTTTPPAITTLRPEVKFTTTRSEVATEAVSLDAIASNTDTTQDIQTTIVTVPPKLELEWTMVSTIAPHNISHHNLTKISQSESASQTESKLPQPSRPVDLNPMPQLGGLEETTKDLDQDIYQFVALCNELAFGFWKSVTTGISSARSVVLSPFAATSLLAMVFLGARGATSGEMNEILRLDDMVTFNPHLIFKNVSESLEVGRKEGVATSVILRELYSDKAKGHLLNFYKERAKAFYDGHVEEVSFKEIGDVVRRRTNLIVKKLTDGKIPEYIKDTSITVKSPLAGVSASIFQTDCSDASMDGRDGELYFVVLPSIRQRRLVPVPAAVWRSNFLAGYDPSLDATAVALGNKQQIVSTIFVIPGQQGIAAPGDGLARLERSLIGGAFKEKAWSRLLMSLIPRPGLEVQIPRFQHRSIINATVALQQMGMKDLFDAAKADLRGLNGVANDLYLSDILQVNNFATCGEEIIGETHHSEIYPATANRTYRRSRKFKDLLPPEGAYYDSELSEEPRDYQRAFHDPLHDPSLYALPLPLRPRQARLPDPPRLRFDRPFLYFVRHNPTGLILHMGRFNPRLLP